MGGFEGKPGNASSTPGTPGADPELARLESTFERVTQVIELHYQPIVRARDRAIFGWEALLRSRDPEWYSPAPILSAAERLNRWPKLGRQLRAMAAEQFAHETAARGLVFVNLHAIDLLDSSLSSRFAPLSKIADRVVLEITERASLENLTRVRNQVADLKQMGYRIAIDDLGAGAARMKDFAMTDTDFVKLDISVVRDIDSHPMKQQFVASIVSMCHEHRIGVIGEGVETERELDTLVGLGCDYLQGFYLARPGPPFVSVASN